VILHRPKLLVVISVQDEYCEPKDTHQASFCLYGRLDSSTKDVTVGALPQSSYVADICHSAVICVDWLTSARVRIENSPTNMMMLATTVLTMGDMNTRLAFPSALPYAAVLQQATNPNTTAKVAGMLSRCVTFLGKNKVNRMGGTRPSAAPYTANAKSATVKPHTRNTSTTPTAAIALSIRIKRDQVASILRSARWCTLLRRKGEITSS